jgi:HEAT repeat protein
MAKKIEKSLPFEEALMRLDTNEPIEDAALRGLSDLGSDGLTRVDKMMRVLDDERRVEVISAMRKLSMEDIEANFEGVFRAGLADVDPRVRAESALGLWESPNAALISPLVKMLRTDSSKAVRAAAAGSLGHFLMEIESGQVAQTHRAEIVDALMQVVRRESDDTPLYQRALESVSYAGTPEVDFFLRSAVASEDANLRLAGVIGMGRSDDQAYQSLVRAELGHVSPHIRREAARAAGELEDADAVPALGELLEDSEMSVREAVLESLAYIGGKDAKRMIDEVLASDDDEMKAKADDALQLYQLMHGDFNFNMELFDEGARTSFHSIKPEKPDQPDAPGKGA